MRILNYANLSTTEIETIQTELAGQENLLQVLGWANKNHADFLPAIVADVVVQDEFTHDVIVPWRDLYLVYDTT